MTGGKLKQLRRKAGLTQTALAKKIGVASNTVARWERGERVISIPVARLIKLILSRSV